MAADDNVPDVTASVEVIEAVTEFNFVVPEGDAEAVWKLNAPDGCTLHMKRPGNVLVGDQIVMSRGEDGKWAIKHVVRSEAVSQFSVNGEVKPRSEAELKADLEDTRGVIQKVQLETTKGPIILQLCPPWAPLGTTRFLQLVLDGFYSDLAIYRAVPKFLIQFGVSGQSKEAEEKYKAIDDDPLRGVPIQAGSICFAASGPNTRCCTICIFLNDFPQLGKNPWETPIGKVHPESMATLKSLCTEYGDMPQCNGKGPDPTILEEKGNDYIKEKFPKIDFVKKASWISE